MSASNSAPWDVRALISGQRKLFLVGPRVAVEPSLAHEIPIGFRLWRYQNQIGRLELSYPHQTSAAS